ncbi:MAG: CBS domain-containing protein [Deltaproteobacteria bacterium]|nr:CBS domain-containing protein [Deltaproteobacteria bacterium]
MPEFMISTLYLGALLILCLMMGRFVSHFRVPKVTGYLLAGILLSPSAINIFSNVLSQRIDGSICELRFLCDLALGLIAFSIGGEFQNERFKKMGKKIITISLCETFATFFLVFCSLFFFTTNLPVAICLGILAIATAPAATLLVLREYDSEGVVTNSLLILTGLNNFICLTLFTICFPTVIALSHGESSTTFILTLFSSLGSMLVSLAAGFILGFLLSVFEKRITKANELIVLTVGTIILGIGLAQMLNVSPLLVNLVMGATVINIAKKGKMLFEELKRIDLPIYAAFFALSGASLHWDLLSVVGGVGVLYVAGRVAGKVLGVFYGAVQARASQSLKRYGGCGLLAQAGVALGLALLIEDRDQKLGEVVSTTIFSTVIVFEILGPLAVRWSIVKSGEVKVIKLIHRDEGTPFRDTFREIILRLRHSLGIPVWKSKQFTGEVLVEHVMRTHVEVIHEETHLDQILKVIEHSRYNLFPVVNEIGEFTGMISFQDIRDVLYDGIMKDLVIAKDVANPAGPFIHSKATINEALDLFELEKTDLLPVIDDRETKHLMGILTQRDVLAVFKGKKR